MDCDCFAVAGNAALFKIRIQVKSEAPPTAAERARKFSSAQGEDHVHRGLHFHRLVVEQVRPVSPGLDRLQSSLLQHGRSAEDTADSRSVPVLEIVAWSTTVPDTRAALAIGG